MIKSSADSKPLVIVGASARAAAESALRAGWTPYCVDQFADADLREFATVLESSRYPHDAASLCRQLPPAPWMYTGAMENHTSAIEAIAGERELLGNPVDVVRRARDPFLFHRALSSHEIPALDVRRHDRPPSTGDWLVKPLRSSGGHAIRRWDGSSGDAGDGFYFQRTAAGASCSALFLGQGSASHLVGCVKHFSTQDGLGAPPFGWCGCIGPWSPTRSVRDALQSIGGVLVKDFRLRGLFGVDFILEDGKPLVTEVNPRYTASVEVFELAWGASLLTHHVCAFQHGNNENTLAYSCDSSAVVAKAIPYARHDLIAPKLNPRRGARTLDSLSGLADIPRSGVEIPRGNPVCTVIAVAECEARCRRQMEAELRGLSREFGLPDEWRV